MRFNAEENLKALLDSRHRARIVWGEPWPACGPEGNRVDAHVELSVSVHDCINLQRAAAKQAGRPTTGDDKQHLLDFISVHWAQVKDE